MHTIFLDRFGWKFPLNSGRQLSAGLLALIKEARCFAHEIQFRKQLSTFSLQMSNLNILASQLEVGDVVFIHVPIFLFQKISDTTESWANHVGIVVENSGEEPIIAESRVPFSGLTTWSRFIARSDAGRVAVKRLNAPLVPQQKQVVLQAAKKRSWILYDTGFNLHSKRQFCSRFVYEVLIEASGISVGKVENFEVLLQKNPKTDLKFWKLWYFGKIPWERKTITPASLFQSNAMHTVFDGKV